MKGEGWSQVLSLYRGDKFSFPPGGLAFVALGVLIVVPGVALLLFLTSAIFQDRSPAFNGMLLFSGALLLTLVHCGFMLRVSLGYIYAQHDLVRYLAGLTGTLLGCLLYGLITHCSSAGLWLALFGSVGAALMVWLGKSRGFSHYAEFLRAKRLYLLKKDQLRQVR